MSQAKERITAFDFARALAIFGMVMVNYKLAMQAESGGPVWLQAIAGLLRESIRLVCRVGWYWGGINDLESP